MQPPLSVALQRENYYQQDRDQEQYIQQNNEGHPGT
jgi:hypothetical protein